MALTPRKQLSLDANLLFDLAEGKDFAHDFREEFQRRGYRLLLPPTVRHELHTIYTDGASAADRELARSALVSLRGWGIQPFDLDSTAETIARRFTQDLLDRRLLPDEEFNDGLILAESSMAEIPLLVTSTNTCWTLTRTRCCWLSTRPTCQPFDPFIPSDCSAPCGE